MARSLEKPALHGRVAELDLLEAQLRRAAGGVLQAVLIEGEPGIGKTRLLDAALERARTAGFGSAFGHADELGRARPFGPLADALGCSSGANDPRAAEVGRLLAEHEPARDLGLQFRLVDAFLDLVEEQAVRTPLALALDDLHWADSSTLLVILSLARRLKHVPLMLLATLRPLPRPSVFARGLDRLERDGACRLMLGPLDADAIANLVADVVQAEPTTSLLEEAESAGGNPLFVTELIRALTEEGTIDIVDGRARVRGHSLPPSLPLTIMRRLSYLDEEILAILRVAAVLGSTFASRDVATVMDRPAASLAGPLSDAVSFNVLEARGERLGFRHELIRAAIYDDLPRDIRAALHRDAGHRLAKTGAPTVQIAEQIALGAEPEDPDAASWLRRAAEEISSRDPAAAIRFLRRALDLVPTTDSRDDRNDIAAELATLLAYAGSAAEAESIVRDLLAAPHDASLEGPLYATLVHALFAEGRWADVVAEVEAARRGPRTGERARARLLAESALARIWLGDLDGAAADAEAAVELGEAVDDPVAVCFGLGHLSVVADQRGHFDEGVDLARRGVETATRAHATDAERRQPHIALGMALLASDRLHDAKRALDEGRRLGERAGTAWDLPLYHVMLALPLYYLGDWDDALAEIEAGLTLADELESGVGRVTGLALLGDIAVHRDQLQAAEEAIGAASAIVERLGPQWGSSWLTLARSRLLKAAGDEDGALAILRASWNTARAGGWIESSLRAGPTLARAAVQAGEHEFVRAVASEMETMAEAAAIPYAQGGALLCRALADDDASAALRAVDIYRGSQRAPEIATACEDSGWLLATTTPADARPFFEEALTTYEGLGAVRDSARVLASMRALGLGRKRRGARKRPVSGWESLTPSELEVVRLAAEGLTNPEIGTRLFISRRTVQTHLAHAFRKLDISSRVELAAEAARRGGA